MRGQAMRYLTNIGERFEAIERDVPRLTELAGAMASGLLAGGHMSAPLLLGAWRNEYWHRAGGMIDIREFPEDGHKDVAYVALPDPRRWKAAEDETLKKLMATDARIFVNGRREELVGAGLDLARFSGFTGGAPADEGWGRLGSVQPLVGFRAFEQFVRGWVTFGEMVAACTRAGRMPILYMSVWLEGGFVRNARFLPQGNTREPWRTPTFHENTYIPPLASGYVAGSFLTEARKIHQTLLGQSEKLAQAAGWMEQAKRARRRIHAVAVGHSFPEILEIPGKTHQERNGNYPLEWGKSLSDLNRAVPEDFGHGDVSVHLGYAPVDVGDVKRILDRGIRFIYSSPYGRPAALEDHPNLLWLDLPWRPADATVDIPGYSVRVLPMSSTAHAMAYFAIVAELVERMGWA